MDQFLFSIIQNLVIVILVGYPLYRMFKKAGISTKYWLAIFIPYSIGIVVVILVLAFLPWATQEQTND